MERNEVRGNFRYDWCIDMFPLIQIQKMFPADLFLFPLKINVDVLII